MQTVSCRKTKHLRCDKVDSGELFLQEIATATLYIICSGCRLENNKALESDVLTPA